MIIIIRKNIWEDITKFIYVYKVEYSYSLPKFSEFIIAFPIELD